MRASMASPPRRRDDDLCDVHESEQYSGRRPRAACVLISGANAPILAAETQRPVGLVDPKMRGRFGELGQKETAMRKRFSGSMITVAIAGAAVSAGISVPITRTLAQAPVFSATAPATALKTPWGEPDLQGIWTDETETPLQRPAKYAAQEFFTEAQRAELDKERTEMLNRRVAGTLADAYNFAAFLSTKRTGARTSKIERPPRIGSFVSPCCRRPIRARRWRRVAP